MPRKADWSGHEEELVILEKEWSPSNKMALADLTPSSHKSGEWICPNGHVWIAPVYTRDHGKSGCPYCAGKRPIMGETDLASRYPELCKEWSDKNLPTRPTDLTYGSAKMVWWHCHVCGNEWQDTVKHRAGGGRGCPVCSGRRPGKDNHNLAVDAPDVAATWNYDRNDKTPSDYTIGSNARVWWVCDKGHEWTATINTRTRKSGPRGCPICDGKQVLAGYNDLASTEPEVMESWDMTRNKMSPTSVTRGSNQYAYWLCNEGHSYRMKIKDRTKGCGCPICAGKGRGNDYMRRYYGIYRRSEKSL